jgi:hypothetical protein
VNDDAWRLRRACAQRPTADFYPDDPAAEAAVAAWCGSHCPVTAQCATSVMAEEARAGSCHGVAGALTATARSMMVFATADPAPPEPNPVEVIAALVRDHPTLSSRGIAELATARGCPVSYRTVARRRREAA